MIYHLDDCDEANDQITVPTTSTQKVTRKFDSTMMTYTFAVNDKNISVNVDSSGKITYDGDAVTDNKITADGTTVKFGDYTVEVSGAKDTLNLSSDFFARGITDLSTLSLPRRILNMSRSGY